MQRIFKYGLLVIVFALSIACTVNHSSDPEPVYIRKNLGTKEGQKSVLFLLHGYGSNEKDLLDLTDLFPNHGNVIALRAPLELQPGAYCWFPRQGHSTGTQVDTTAYSYAGELLERWIADILEKEGLSDARLFVAGFSQGAMMSYELARRNAVRYAGIIGFSGSAKALNALHQPSQCGTDIFMSHGEQDGVLLYESALQAKSKLEACGAQVEMHTFVGGHQITPEVIAQAHQWLMSRWTAQ